MKSQGRKGQHLTGFDRPAAKRICWLGIVGIALTTSSCSSDRDTVALPSPTDSATARPSSSTAVEKEVIKKAYTEFVAMLDRADSIPRASRVQQLSSVMVEPQLSKVLGRIDTMKDKGIITYGTTVVHVKRIQLTGDGAVLYDCQDSSRAGLMNTRTHEKTRRGVKEGNIKALLSKGTGGRWKVSKSIVLGEGC